MDEEGAHKAPADEADAFLDGRLKLLQPKRGHRAGTDALLLAAAAPRDFAGFALDVGAGVGAAGLALALTRPAARIGLLELDPDTAALARENVALNRLSDRGRVFEADLLSPRARRGAGLVDEAAQLVVTNPPFHDPGRARLSPDAAKRRAHAMPAGGTESLVDWLAASLALVEPGGSIVLIHRPEALPAIFEALGGRAGAIVVLPIYPRDGAAAIRVLVRAKKGSRAPVSLAPGLVLHEGMSFTKTAEAIHRGAAAIEW
ncbi:tRNA1(Val) (adenine(37)-N6)-methyltransferase [Methylocapsa acidiphila]|uniref:tRNA1(Val) (adenine(37)-N6)-methyltransferase n=1 Tax=Methylocapsa acidiphila TaxID=133552 RepID=UPI00040ABAF4|nr:methyltransferase [Methylocapsa acidiphila]